MAMIMGRVMQCLHGSWVEYPCR